MATSSYDYFACGFQTGHFIDAQAHQSTWSELKVYFAIADEPQHSDMNVTY